MSNQDKHSLDQLERDDQRFNDTKSRPNRVKQPYKRDRKRIEYEDYTDDDDSEEFE